MKHLTTLLLATILFFTACKNTTSVEEFKMYHQDAPNEIARHIDNFSSFGEINYYSRGNGYFDVVFTYYDKLEQPHKANGVFKYNGKYIYHFIIS